MILDHDRKIYKVQEPPKKGHRHTHDTLSMCTIIERLEAKRISQTQDRKNPILGRKHKRIIAVLLAHALVQYCGGVWLDEQWDKNSISFLRHSSGDRLVLSTNLKASNQGPDLEAEARMHEYPGILALAIIMLEMELGKTIETARSEQEDFDVHEPNSNTDWNAAYSMYEDDEIQDDTIAGFRSAVKACLDFSYWNDNTEPDDLINHREKLYRDLALRRKIHQEIVIPLERELYMSFPDINLDDPLKFTFWDNVEASSHVVHQKQRLSPRFISSISDVVMTTTQSTGTSIVAKLQATAKIDALISHQVFFHDVPLSISDAR